MVVSLALAGPPAPAKGIGPLSWSSYQDCVRSIQAWGGQVPDWIVQSRLLVYPARKPSYGPDGNPVPGADGRQASTLATLTGRVFFPPSWRLWSGSTLPLVVYPHATELRKDAVPSAFGGHEWALGAAAAAWYGFAVAMPDLPGMGGDAGAVHPFCHALSLAWATVDSIPAALALFGSDPGLAGRRWAWDGRLFLVGYSEGGYAALASARELETHADQYPDRPLTGSACMAGPFDLSGAMRATFIDPSRPYSRAYYLPYFVLGYHGVYGPRLDPLQVFAPDLLAPGPDGDILAWFDGTRDGEAVDEVLGRRLGLPADGIILRRLFDPGWLARELDDPAYAGSGAHGLLAENDLLGGWAPTRPILFCHSPDDGNVPYANTLAAKAGLEQAVRQAGRDPSPLLLLLDLGRPGDGIGHTEGAYLALPAAFAWFHYGMPDPGTLVRCPGPWAAPPASSPPRTGP
jgi:hypothetical protein